MDGVACGKPWGTGAFDSPRSRSAETNNDARRCCRRAVSLPSRTFGEGSLAVIGHRGVECASRRIARSCVDGRRHTLVVVCCFLSPPEPTGLAPAKRAARARARRVASPRTDFSSGRDKCTTPFSSSCLNDTLRIFAFVVPLRGAAA